MSSLIGASVVGPGQPQRIYTSDGDGGGMSFELEAIGPPTQNNVSDTTLVSKVGDHYLRCRYHENHSLVDGYIVWGGHSHFHVNLLNPDGYRDWYHDIDFSASISPYGYGSQPIYFKSKWFIAGATLPIAPRLAVSDNGRSWRWVDELPSFHGELFIIDDILYYVPQANLTTTPNIIYRTSDGNTWEVHGTLPTRPSGTAFRYAFAGVDNGTIFYSLYSEYISPTVSTIGGFASSDLVTWDAITPFDFSWVDSAYSDVTNINVDLYGNMLVGTLGWDGSLRTLECYVSYNEGQDFEHILSLPFDFFSYGYSFVGGPIFEGNDAIWYNYNELFFTSDYTSFSNMTVPIDSTYGIRNVYPAGDGKVWVTYAHMSHSATDDIIGLLLVDFRNDSTVFFSLGFNGQSNTNRITSISRLGKFKDRPIMAIDKSKDLVEWSLSSAATNESFGPYGITRYSLVIHGEDRDVVIPNTMGRSGRSVSKVTMDNGLSWVNGQPPPPIDAALVDNTVSSGAYSPSLGYLVTTRTGIVFTSRDGLQWNKYTINIPGGSGWNKVIWDDRNGLWVLARWGNTYGISNKSLTFLVSEDGILWTERAYTHIGEEVSGSLDLRFLDIVKGNVGFVYSIGTIRQLFVSSADGMQSFSSPVDTNLTRHYRYSTSGNYRPRVVDRGDDKMSIVGRTGDYIHIATTSDGIHWDEDSWDQNVPVKINDFYSMWIDGKDDNGWKIGAI